MTGEMSLRHWMRAVQRMFQSLGLINVTYHLQHPVASEIRATGWGHDKATKACAATNGRCDQLEHTRPNWGFIWIRARHHRPLDASPNHGATETRILLKHVDAASYSPERAVGAPAGGRFEHKRPTESEGWSICVAVSSVASVLLDVHV